MKIYRLKVTYETVVRGSSVHAVECAANRIIRDSDDEPESEAVEITDISELPIGWDGNCRPWGVTDPHEWRCDPPKHPMSFAVLHEVDGGWRCWAVFKTRAGAERCAAKVTTRRTKILPENDQIHPRRA